MIEQYFTFGHIHVHPETGESMKDNVIKIIARDKQRAREIMIKHYGNKWAFQYDEMPESHPQGFYEFKLYEVLLK